MVPGAGCQVRVHPDRWHRLYHAERPITEFRAPSAEPSVGGLAAGADGALWFTDARANRIYRMQPSGKLVAFSLSACLSDPFGITLGPDGNLWFAARAEDKPAIVQITPRGAMRAFRLPAFAVDLTRGPDGAVWFTEDSGIGRLSMHGQVTIYPVSPAWGLSRDYAGQITAGPDGDLWFTRTDYYRTTRVDRMNLSGEVIFQGDVSAA